MGFATVGQGTLIIAIDKEVSAVAIISVPYQYLDKVTDEFSEIKHIKEMEGNRDKYLREYFKPILEKVLDKYPIEIRYYLKVDHYFWEDLEYLSKWGLELIVDDGLWTAVKDRFGGTQVSLVKEGEIRKRIRELKKRLREAKRRKDTLKEDEIMRELKIERRRRILITIADNYLHLKKRGIGPIRRQKNRKH